MLLETAWLPSSVGTEETRVGLLPAVYHVMVSKIFFVIKLFMTRSHGTSKFHVQLFRCGRFHLIERKNVRLGGTRGGRGWGFQRMISGHRYLLPRARRGGELQIADLQQNISDIVCSE